MASADRTSGIVEPSVGGNPVEGLSTIVVAGDRFAPVQVDHLLFGEPDPDGQLLAGPVAQFSYRNGQCSLSIVPNRVDLRMTGGNVLPDELVAVASQVLSKLELLCKNGVIVVTALGMNHDTVFPRDPREFCTNLTRLDAASTILGVEAPEPSLTFRFVEEAFQYTVRVEPELASQGQ